MATMGVKLDKETCDRLKRLGEARQRSAHWLMCEAIARYLDSEEQYEQEKVEDEARWQRYLDTGNHITQEDMESWLNQLASEAARKGQP